MSYPFKVQIRESSKNLQWYAVLVGLNGQDVFVQETRPRRSDVKAFINKWFPGVKIEIVPAPKVLQPE